MSTKLRRLVRDSIVAMLDMPTPADQEPWFETARLAAWLRLDRPRKPSRTNRLLADNTLRAAMADRGIAGIVAPEFCAYRRGRQVRVKARPAYAAMVDRSDPLGGWVLGGPGGRGGRAG